MAHQYTNAYAKGWHGAALRNVGQYNQWRSQFAVREAVSNAYEVIAIEANYDLENWKDG